MNAQFSQKSTLKDYRMRKGLTQQMVANIIGISTSHYSNIENKNRGINYKIDKRLAACYSISLEIIFKCSESWAISHLTSQRIK